MSQTFRPFPRLSGELRNMIWVQAQLINVRILEVRWASDTGFEFKGCNPALHSVCRESRSIAKPLYEGDQITINEGRRILMRSQRHVRKRAFFNFDKDIIYFPYHFQCSQTYGLLLESLLRALSPEHAAKLRHLALCLPLQLPQVETSAEMLNDLRSSSIEIEFSASAKDSMSFFTNLQALGRRPRSLSLESLTLVYHDPIIQMSWSLPPKEVSRIFNELAMRNEARELWEARKRYCGWVLSQPHEKRGDYPNYSLQERNKPDSTWGNSDIEIRMSTVERRYDIKDDQKVP